MTARLMPPQPKAKVQRHRPSVGMPPINALLAALPDFQLELLYSLQVLLGTRASWPSWAMNALSERDVDEEGRDEFRRLLLRAWPTARRFEERMALEFVAKRFNLPLPDSRNRSENQPVRRRRTPAYARSAECENAALNANDVASSREEDAPCS